MATRISIEDVFAASQKIALTRATVLAYILPPIVCLYLMGVLVQLEGTRFHRLAFLPAVLWFAWRGIFVDLSGGDLKQGHVNDALINCMCYISMRGALWAVARRPFRRQSLSNKLDPESVYTAFWNAWDLTCNRRGIGWNWPRGFIVPRATFETDSRIVFVLLSAARFAFHAVCFDVCVQIIRMLSPDTFGSLDGGSLFDHTLPPFLELLRSVFVTFLAVCMMYFMLQWFYQFLAIIGIVLLQQHPSQWPPLFDSPWLSTSLTELWGRRWHQLWREEFFNLGGRPFDYLFGRLGGLLGTFLVSGIFHDIEHRSFGRGGNSATMIGSWVMHGVGVVLERIWTRTTGRRVGGVWGWMWMFGWIALWGVWAVDEWAKAGRFAAFYLPGELEPSLALAALVRGWLARL